MDHQANPYASPKADSASPSELRTREQRRLRLIYFGVAQVYWAYLILALGAMSATSGVFIHEYTMDPDSVTSHAGLVLAIVGMSLAGVGLLVAMLGHLFCLAIPSERSARGWIVLSAIFQSTGLLTTICQFETPRFLLLCEMSVTAGMAVFLLFAKEVGQLIQCDALQSRINRILATVACSFLVLLLASGLALTDVVHDVVGVVLVVSASIVALIVLVMYVLLVRNLGKRVKQRLKGLVELSPQSQHG